ncbi:hypothetical protein CEXT_794001 [Caerostris extrusa]|uniref:Uncharacterized protein n=1 Tax=Caerostris extrusa TaxID=172846 RepID=A0AAV4VG31_CAEEX|nr:hypothetical protein CEXT_794001 [Caerostris extrusa]
MVQGAPPTPSPVSATENQQNHPVIHNNNVNNFNSNDATKAIFVLTNLLPPARRILNFRQKVRPYEQGIAQTDSAYADMDTNASVTKEDLAKNDFLIKNPASKRVLEPTLEHYLFFEELLKEGGHSNGQGFSNTRVLPRTCGPQLGDHFPAHRGVQ